MEPLLIWKLLHVVSVGFFAGSLLAVLMVQSLLQRSLEAKERNVLASAASTVARVIVNPLAILGFLSGLVYWYARQAQFGLGRLMTCTPVYIHIMLTCGFLAVGMVQVWKARARKLAQALEKGAPADEIRAHATRGWIFALLSLLFISTAYAVAILKVPSVIPPACFAGDSRN